MEQTLVFKENLHGRFLPFPWTSLPLGQGWRAGAWRTSVISQKAIASERGVFGNGCLSYLTSAIFWEA